jgi:putative ABC transport system substrate-binding protein
MHFEGLKRREFITLLGGMAAAWPLTAGAQEASRIYRLGVLSGASRDAPYVAAMFDELREAGFAEGQNLMILPGSFGVGNERLAEVASTFVKAAPDAIFCAGPVAARAAQEATRAFPLVAISPDLVAEGRVSSLARPGGNLTGMSLFLHELDGKRQDILIEAAPSVRRIAVLADPEVTGPSRLQPLLDSAHARDIELKVFSARNAEQISPAMNEIKAWGATALNVLAAPLFSINRRAVILRATALHLPAIYEWPEMAEDGGLAAYGARLVQIYRQAGRLLVKVLRGAKPADIPVEQPTRFELVINLQAAKAIDHEVPAGLVLRADKVIE